MRKLATRMLWSWCWEWMAFGACVLTLALLALAVVPREAQAGKPCEVPKAWGPLRGITNHALGMMGEHTRLAFEDEAGTVRVISGDSCKTVLEVTRTP